MHDIVDTRMLLPNYTQILLANSRIVKKKIARVCVSVVGLSKPTKQWVAPRVHSAIKEVPRATHMVHRTLRGSPPSVPLGFTPGRIAGR